MNIQHSSARRRLLQGLALSPVAWRSAHAATAAPTFNLPGPDGPVNLAALRERVVLLDFWASWCTPCRLSFPWLAEMQARHGARGLQVVAINVDRQRSDADTFLARTPARFSVAFDPAGDTPRRYAVRAMPSSVLVGRDGALLLQHAGFRDEDKPALEAAIVSALALR